MKKRKISRELDSRRKNYIKALLTKPDKELSFCVLGAGHGGLAMAGHLALMGYSVNLFNRGRRKILPVAHRGGIRVEGSIEGFGKVNLASTNIKLIF